MPDTPVTPTPAPTPAPQFQLPGWFLAMVAVGFFLMVTIAVAGGAAMWMYLHPGPAVKPFDSALVATGQAYAAKLAPTCATAWDEAADMLDAGQPYSTALAHAAASWTTGRQTFFDQIVTPALSKIVPEATKDTDVTPVQRAAAAKAWRGFAKGLTK